MNQSVGTSPVAVDLSARPDVGGAGQVVLLQNLGTGDLYVDFADDVSATSGLKIVSGATLEVALPASQTLYAVASVASTDLRILVVS